MMIDGYAFYVDVVMGEFLAGGLSPTVKNLFLFGGSTPVTKMYVRN